MKNKEETATNNLNFDYVKFVEMFMKEVEQLLKNYDNKSKQIYINNVKHILTNNLNNINDDLEKSCDNFSHFLNLKITLKNGSTVDKAPPNLIPKILEAFKQCLSAQTNLSPSTPNNSTATNKSINNSNTKATAANTKSIIQNNRPTTIDDSPNNSDYGTEKIHYADHNFKAGQTSGFGKISIVTNEDSQNLAYKYNQQGKKVLVMNAANAYHIGGGFEKNYGTQEESLFFTSDLHRRLYKLGEKQKDNVYHYTTPLSHTDLNLNNQCNALHTKNVWFFAKANSVEDTTTHKYAQCEPFHCGVFTIPGYDLRDKDKTKHYERDLFEDKGLLNWNTQFDWDKFKDAQKKKFQLFFETAVQNGYDTVIAAPLSCGAFAHPQGKEKTYQCVAEAFFEAALQYEDRINIDLVAINPAVAKEFVKVENNKNTPNLLSQGSSSPKLIHDVTNVRGPQVSKAITANNQLLSCLELSCPNETIANDLAKALKDSHVKLYNNGKPELFKGFWRVKFESTDKASKLATQLLNPNNTQLQQPSTTTSQEKQPVEVGKNKNAPNLPSQVSSSPKLIHDEHESELMLLDKVVKDLKLDKSTTITKEQNYNINFKNLEDADRFSEFLFENSIKDPSEGGFVPIFYENTSSLQFTTSQIDIINLIYRKNKSASGNINFDFITEEIGSKKLGILDIFKKENNYSINFDDPLNAEKFLKFIQDNDSSNEFKKLSISLTTTNYISLTDEQIKELKSQVMEKEKEQVNEPKTAVIKQQVEMGKHKNVPNLSSQVSSSPKSIHHENESEFRLLEKVVRDLELDKSTTITKEQNYNINFKNLGDADRFSEFLSENSIKDPSEGGFVPIFYENTSSLQFTTSQIDIINLIYRKNKSASGNINFDFITEEIGSKKLGILDIFKKENNYSINFDDPLNAEKFLKFIQDNDSSNEFKKLSISLSTTNYISLTDEQIKELKSQVMEKEKEQVNELATNATASVNPVESPVSFGTSLFSFFKTTPTESTNTSSNQVRLFTDANRQTKSGASCYEISCSTKELNDLILNKLNDHKVNVIEKIEWNGSYRIKIDREKHALKVAELIVDDINSQTDNSLQKKL